MKLDSNIRLYFQTTNICTNKCRFCPYEHPKKPETISNKNYEKCLLTLKDYLDKNVVYLDMFCPYNSNEPFTDKNFNEKMRIFFKHFPHRIIQNASNGTLLTEEISKEYIDILADNAAEIKHEIYFNLPCIDEKSFKFQTGRDDFKQVLENTLNFIRINNNKIKIFFKTEWDENCGYTPQQVFEFWNSLKISGILKKHIIFEVMQPHDRGGLVKEFDLKVRMTDFHGCFYKNLLNSVYIIQNGDVITCCNDWNVTLPVGNLFKNTFEEVINSNSYWDTFLKIHGIRESPKDFICKQCFFSKGIGSKPNIDIKDLNFRYGGAE